MARVKNGPGEQADRELRAAASGSEAVARAHAGVMNQYQAGAQQAQQLGDFAARTVGQGEQLKLQNDQLDLEAAEKGFERGGGSAREQALQQEMDRGAGQPAIGPLETESQNRLRMQGEKPLEMDGGTWRPTAERRAEMKRKNFEADTERIRAEAYRDQVAAQHAKADAAGDEKAADELAAELAGPANSGVKRFDRMMKGDVQDSDWADLADEAKGSEEVDPSLMQDISSKNFSPRVQQFARAQISVDAIKSIARTGTTDKLKVDWTAPQMRAFTEQVHHFNSLAKTMGPGFAQVFGINSVKSKMKLVNKLAANAVMAGMHTAPDPFGGMPPSAGGAGGEGSPAGGGEPPMASQDEAYGNNDPNLGGVPLLSRTSQFATRPEARGLPLKRPDEKPDTGMRFGPH